MVLFINLNFLLHLSFLSHCILLILKKSFNAWPLKKRPGSIEEKFLPLIREVEELRIKFDEANKLRTVTYRDVPDVPYVSDFIRIRNPSWSSVFYRESGQHLDLMMITLFQWLKAEIQRFRPPLRCNKDIFYPKEKPMYHFEEVMKRKNTYWFYKLNCLFKVCFCSILFSYCCDDSSKH